MTRPRTRSQSGIVKPKQFHDDMVRYGFYSATGESETTEEAFGDPKWRKAMEVEYNALLENKTWRLVPN